MNPWAYVLLIALAGDVGFGWLWLHARDTATAAEVERDAARGEATTCSDATEQLRILADKSLADGKAARAKAGQLAKDAGARADAELSRAPAVPGDACASAAKENAEWLVKRREKP